MKKVFSLLILVIILFSFSFNLAGCGSYLRLQETKIFDQALEQFFNALDAGNEDIILSLFSESARQADTDIKDQIRNMISEYPRADTTLPSNILHAGSYYKEDGLFSSSTFALFPVISNSTYYWFYIDLTYEDDFNSENIGIREIIFFTADEYCITFHQDTPIPTEDGLFVYADRVLDAQIRCINRIPHEFTPLDRVMTLSDVEAHIAQNKDFSKFIEEFGPPNANRDLLYYFELLIPEEPFAYLEISVNKHTNQIEYAQVVSDMEFIRTILEEDT